MSRLSQLSRTKLEELIESLSEKFGTEVESHINQFISNNMTKKAIIKNQHKAKAEDFDFNNYRTRHVAIQIQYEGEPYFGFASQSGDCEETVEKHIFESLIKVKLINDRKSCDYSRCGRTDAGVSAFGQVIALNLRSIFPKDDAFNGKIPKHVCDALKVMKKMKKGNEKMERLEDVVEIDYCSTLNRVLPAGIRAISWKEVTPGFNARFSAGSRTYRYFFLSGKSNPVGGFASKPLNIERMRQAARLLVGEHDFRNFCKMDVTHVSNFVREVYSAEIKLFSSTSNDGDTAILNENCDIYVLEISGLAFLWHMVRCIMAVLFLVGYEKEDPSVVTMLFDIEKFPAKPQYNMAPELPLVLCRCGFDNLEFNNHSPKVLVSLYEHFQKQYELHRIASARYLNCMSELRNYPIRKADIEGVQLCKTEEGHPCKRVKMDDDMSTESEEISFNDYLQAAPVQDITQRALLGATQYLPLLTRPVGGSYDERCNHLTGKKQERYKKHIDLKGKARALDPEFFARMRSQGDF